MNDIHYHMSQQKEKQLTALSSPSAWEVLLIMTCAFFELNFSTDAVITMKMSPCKEKCCFYC